jgi:ABC-2 type transport system ATP-binding protein
MSVVVCDGVTKVYRRARRAALVQCSFAAEPGEILGLVGPNGAGKSTLLGLLAGELAVSAGTAVVDGHRAGTREARRAAGYAADPPLAPPELTGMEWLTYLASHRARSPRERLALVREAVELGELEDFASRRTGAYSRGMMQRLALGAARVTAGTVLLLDEVLNGIDPLVQRRVRGRVAALARGGRLIILASHDLGTVERLATRVLVLCRGRVAADVSTADLVSARVVEIAVTGSGVGAVRRLLDRFPSATRTETGVAVPLERALTVEHVLAACGELRIAVGASRVRYRALEDILVAADGDR